MSFLGIDQSLNGTGLCRLSHAEAIETSVTLTHDDLRDGERLAFIKRGVASLLRGVEFAALEGYSYNSVNQPFSLGEIGGVLKVLLVESNVPYVIVPPILVKKFATGSTYADKDAMLLAAKARGHIFTDDNQADAFFLACVARAFSKDTARYRCELEVLRTLRNPPKDKKTKRRGRRLIKNAI